MEKHMLKHGALDGIKVLDLSRLLPGPFCSMILADHGADVIAIEDGTRGTPALFFNGVNRNKRHMSLNLKSDEGREIFYRMAKDADVILEGFRPGVVARLGVDYDTIKEINPRIVYCAITGYGQTGPFKKEAGHDVNYLSHAGVLDLIGEPDSPPSIPGIQVADIAGGSMNAAMGILLALFAREKTGKGQYIDISMTDGVAGFLLLPKDLAKLSGGVATRSQGMLSHRYACYNTYKTSDNRSIAVGAVEPVFWQRLCDHLGKPEFIPLQYDETRRGEIIAWLRGVFATKSGEAWDEELSKIDACTTLVKTMNEALASDLFASREMAAALPSSNGKAHKTVGIPVKLSDTPGSLRSSPEAFGSSTDDILQELGFSNHEIQNLKEEKVI